MKRALDLDRRRDGYRGVNPFFGRAEKAKAPIFRGRFRRRGGQISLRIFAGRPRGIETGIEVRTPLAALITGRRCYRSACRLP